MICQAHELPEHANFLAGLAQSTAMRARLFLLLLHRFAPVFAVRPFFFIITILRHLQAAYPAQT